MAGNPRICDFLACSSHSGASPTLVHVQHARTPLLSLDTANTAAGCHTVQYEYMRQERDRSQPSYCLFDSSNKPALPVHSSVCSNEEQSQVERLLNARWVHSAHLHTRAACPDTSGTASHPHIAHEHVDNSHTHPCTDRRCTPS